MFRSLVFFADTIVELLEIKGMKFDRALRESSYRSPSSDLKAWRQKHTSSHGYYGPPACFLNLRLCPIVFLVL